MNTRRTIDMTYRMARDRRKEAITFFRDQEANPNMPFAARNIAGRIARGLEAIYRYHAWNGDEMKPRYRWIWQENAWMLCFWIGGKPNLPEWSPPRPHVGHRFTS